MLARQERMMNGRPQMFAPVTKKRASFKLGGAPATTSLVNHMFVYDPLRCTSHHKTKNISKKTLTILQEQSLKLRDRQPSATRLKKIMPEGNPCKQGTFQTLLQFALKLGHVRCIDYSLREQVVTIY